MKMRTKQEIEKAIRETITQFLETQLGDRLEAVVTQIEDDAIVVKLKDILPPAEKRLIRQDEELGRGEPDVIETGRQITVGEYSGIKGFRNVYEKLEIEFKDEGEAARILELARYANVHNQKPLVEEELKFIAQYPDIACKLLTMSPSCNKC